ncbi:hypothetical protein MMC25_008184 [Agyrium rufum]|nr:hypothetical protein [Agyrium rufum]
MAPMKLGSYLLARVKQLGVNSIFGVPGDFQLGLLDLLPDVDLTWRGSPNELIAAYAADGYSRVTQTPGCLITTFGPGELSALCGIAGSFAESVPVIHIVGYPPTPAIKGGAFLHHTLGPNADYEVYMEMSRGISAATTLLMDSRTAEAEIDRVLEEGIRHSRPVYIGVPADVCWDLVEGTRLTTPLKTKLEQNDCALEKKVVVECRKRLAEAKSAAIIVDAGTTRNNLLRLAEELVDVTGLPFFTTSMSKGALSERHPRFGGFYGGLFSKQDVREAVETADFVLWIGNYPSDLNTGAFTAKVDPMKVIDFARFDTLISGEKVNVKMQYALKSLVESLRQSPVKIQGGWNRPMPCNPWPAVQSERPSHIAQNWFWPRCGELFQEGDLIITETGTSSVGMNDAKLPTGASIFTQTIWGSIGYATGAAVGAFVGALETGKHKRCILFTGEGSLQMVIQALSDLVRFDAKPMIFVINNSGYTIERMIHGKTAFYNDLPDWKYTSMLDVFGPDHKTKSYQVKSTDEVDRLFNDEEFNACKVAQLVEVFMDKEDAPMLLKVGGPMADPFKDRPGQHGSPPPKSVLRARL